MQARSQFVPNVNYSGAVSRGRNDLFGSAFPNNGATTSSAVATLNAFWEVDLWGRVRRLNESARAQFLASEEARRGVRLEPVERCGRGLLALAGVGSGVGNHQRTTNSFGESLKIFTQRLEGGTASTWKQRAPKPPWPTRPPRCRPSSTDFHDGKRALHFVGAQSRADP
jgi:outer membrane protein, multidrug efflux system